MGIKFDIFTGQLVPTGSGGGGGGGPAQRFVQTFNNTTDWTSAAPDYTRTITAAAHGEGINPNVQIYELIAGNYEQVFPNITINASGDITLKVSLSPDTRFTGLILIL